MQFVRKIKSYFKKVGLPIIRTKQWKIKRCFETPRCTPERNLCFLFNKNIRVTKKSGKNFRFLNSIQWH